MSTKTFAMGLLMITASITFGGCASPVDDAEDGDNVEDVDETTSASTKSTHDGIAECQFDFASNPQHSRFYPRNGEAAVTNVTSHSETCATANKIAKAYYKTPKQNTYNTGHYSCIIGKPSQTETGAADVDVRCTASGGKVVHFHYEHGE